MNLQDFAQAANNAAKASSEDIGEALQGFALFRLAPAVAGVYTAGYITGEFVHDLNAKLPRFLRFLGFAA